ncbi:MAG: formimidoylglutamase [Deltaproteobacteria bacterium]|nr:formimidoylglutamase [Deltaproteobacteria bacterium]
MSALPPFAPLVPELPPVRSGDPRVGHILGSTCGDGTKPKLALLGFPFDEGVRLNGGRVGAAAAPASIRKCFYRLTPDAQAAPNFTALLSASKDYGDLICQKDIAKSQELLGQAVSAVLLSSGIPILLGGGHETSFGHFLGFVAARQPVRLINFDAHADVRERISGQSHSGSSFRDALEHPSGLCRGYSLVGLQAHSCARSHVEYLQTRNAQILWAEQVSEGAIAELFAGLSEDALVSIDIDGVDQAYAPGASSPATGGLSARMLLHFAYQAGLCPHVRSLDIVEVNPTYDRDEQTARLAALAIWTFLRGVSNRSKP